MTREYSIIWFCRSLALAALLTSVGSAAEAIIQAGSSATLTGVLQSAIAYGPPNFGENPKSDRKEIYISLTLFVPVNVQETDGTVLPNIVRGELIIPMEQDALAWQVKQFIGAGGVKIIGKIFPATTGHHHEPIVIVVVSVEKINPRAKP